RPGSAGQPCLRTSRALLGVTGPLRPPSAWRACGAPRASPRLCRRSLLPRWHGRSAAGPPGCRPSQWTWLLPSDLPRLPGSRVAAQPLLLQVVDSLRMTQALAFSLIVRQRVIRVIDLLPPLTEIQQLLVDLLIAHLRWWRPRVFLVSRRLHF